MKFSATEADTLFRLLTRPRLQAYLHAAGQDLTAALSLYHWNLELSGAFLIIISISETVIRQAVADALENVHGRQWPWSHGFRQSLSQPRERRDYSPLQDLSLVAPISKTTPDIVRRLKFAFTEAMLTKSQHDRLWAHQLFEVFPGLSNGDPVQDCRTRLYRQVRHLRLLRNRVAHQEPIFQRNLLQDLTIIQSLSAYRHGIAGEWVERAETVSSLLKRMPVISIR